MNEHPIILFDGVCNLCNASVNFLIDRDISRSFRYASLQSDTGKELMRKFQKNPEVIDSVVVVKDGKLHTKSDAALEIASLLPFPYPLSALFRIIPKFLRDHVYDLIARNRYKWFGTNDTCRIPDKQTRELFLE